MITSNPTPTLYSYTSTQQPISQENLSDTNKYKVITLIDNDSSKIFKVFKNLLINTVKSFSSIQIVQNRSTLLDSFNQIVRREERSLKDKQLVVLTLTNNPPLEGFHPMSGWFKPESIERELLPTPPKTERSLMKSLAELVNNMTYTLNHINALRSECQSQEAALKAILEGEMKRTASIKSTTSQATSPGELHLPVLNMTHFSNPSLRPQFIRDLRNAISTYGFFAVQNVGIDRSIIDRAYAQSQAFFKKEIDFKKESQRVELAGQRGWVPGESAKGSGTKDDKEFYHIGKEGAFVENIWPKQSGFKESMTHMYQELEKYVHPLLEALVEAINLNAPEGLKLAPSYLIDQMGNSENNLLRALYYPAVPAEKFNSDPTKPHCWGAAHTDIDLLTILPFATAKGLQVKVDNKWLNVVVPDDAFVVNIGDMLENLTNGLAKSAEHRIVAEEPNQERFSCVFFAHPKSDTQLAPQPSCVAQTGGKQLYAPGTRDEFLFERLLELGIAPGLLDLYHKSGHFYKQMEFGRHSPQVLDQFLKAGYFKA